MAAATNSPQAPEQREPKLSTETTSRENSHTDDEDAVGDPKKCLDFGVTSDENKKSDLSEIDSQVTQEEELKKPSISDRDMAKPPKSLFKPPREITIDPNAVPPSPMKDPANMYSKARKDPEQPLPLLNSGNQGATSVGDPVGDIAMKRQMLDAQRLVRLILGKPLCGDQNLLESNTILQAIRTFALMKQELGELRQMQEMSDGDPPAILEGLASPLGTNTTGARTETTTSPAMTLATPTMSPATQDTTLLKLALATNKVQRLEQQLSEANKLIEMLQQPAGVIEGCQNVSCLQLNASFLQLLRNQEAIVGESQRNLDAVVESVASIPKRVLAKDNVREKLKEYCTTVASQATQLQMLEAQTNTKREQDESQRRIAELEAQLREQKEEHERQLQRMRGSMPNCAPESSIPPLDDESS